MNRRLKIIFITLLIILLSIISFVGLYIQNTKSMDNILPEYILGMDLRGHRAITLKVSDATETIYYDKDGNVVDEEAEDGTSEEMPVNDETDLTHENYLKTKEIVEKRLSDLAITEYLIRLNEENGTLTVELPEDSMTDVASQFLYSRGEFTIEDEDGQVLLDNSNLERVQVGYNQLTTGYEVYLRFEFNDNSIEKLKEMSNTYVSSTDEEGNDTSKNIIVQIDGSQLASTTFDEEITNGVWEYTIGTSSNTNTINSYLNQATNIALLLNSGVFPVEYTITQNRFIRSDLTIEDMFIPAIIVGVICVILFIFMIIRYRKLGLLAVISYIGYMAVLLLIIRFTNLIITLDGICGILILAILNFVLLIYLLEMLKKTEKNILDYKKTFEKSFISILLVLIPTLIIGIVLCFSAWLPAYSFGTIIFWGIFIMGIYNIVITKILFLNSIKE